MHIQTIEMQTNERPLEGKLSVFEGSGHYLPFEIKRIYYIYEVPRGVMRGGHAHKKLRQLLWCPYGRIRIRLDDGHEKAEVLLDTPNKGLVVEHNMWREMLWEKENSVLCVAASEFYEESDYIRDYRQFLRFVREQEEQA